MRSLFVSTMLLGMCCLPVSYARAQTAAPAPPPKPLLSSIATHPDWPKANPDDVKSIDALMSALYDVISGPAGKPRDWARFRSLFIPDGRLGVIRPPHEASSDHPASAGDAVFLTPQDYIDRDDPFFKKNGFFEHGIANRVEEFGNLVSVWSTYESRHNANDAKPFARGINSLQIVHAQGRYWIASILWDEERPGLTLPAKYLRASE
jgi:hypothetical protein